MLTYILAWFLLLLLAIINGVVREAVYKKWVGELTAHQLSTFTLMMLFAIFIWHLMKRYLPDSAAQAFFIGLLWTVLTLLFEFGFGRYRGNSWQKLLEDYNIAKGRLWVLIPLWLLLAPSLFYHLIKKT